MRAGRECLCSGELVNPPTANRAARCGAREEDLLRFACNLIATPSGNGHSSGSLRTQARDGQRFHEAAWALRFGQASLLKLYDGDILVTHWAIVLRFVEGDYF